MCGITGIIQRDKYTAIKDSISYIKHRGPDSNGTYIDGSIELGHQRLSIQDLSPNGHQPMLSADERYVLIFNGEIYNHWEIREELKHKYTFTSSSDTQTILYGFVEYGAALFSKLNGIFALAIYDKQTNEVVIARDQFGVKPLYYYEDEATFMFSSEIKSFFAYPNFKKELDYEALCNYIHFLYSPSEATPFKKVKKLLPGHYITLKTDLKSPKRLTKYYDIPFDGQYSSASEKELIDILEQKLYKAVERQLLADVPVGFFLSGGLDSSLIVAMAKKILPDEKKLTCYTINTGEKKFEGFTPDIHYARKTAQYLDVSLTEIESNAKDIDLLDKMVYHLDEPQADIAPIHVYNICKQAREDGFVVLLGGTAGDDLFSGYRRHQTLYYERILKYIPSFLGRHIVKIVPLLQKDSPISRRIQKFFGELHKKAENKWVGYYAWLPIDINKNLFKKTIQQQLVSYNPEQVFLDSLENIPNETSSLNKMLYWDMKYFLTDHNLNYTDKLAMAVGVEVRVPFLDLELVEFSAKIPPHLKMKGKTTKYLLRKVAERYLPHEIIYRSKTGFGSPIREWVTTNLKEEIKLRLSEENISRQGIFSYEQIAQLIADNESGKVDASYSILALLSIDSWHRQFIEQEK